MVGPDLPWRQPLVVSHKSMTQVLPLPRNVAGIDDPTGIRLFGDVVGERAGVRGQNRVPPLPPHPNPLPQIVRNKRCRS